MRPALIAPFAIVIACSQAAPVPEDTDVLFPQVTVGADNRCFATIPPAPGAFDTFGKPFEALCPDELTNDRIATLQRALQARLSYAGAITGLYDQQTRAAVAAFQTDRGLPSGQLARSTAEHLGIVPVSTPAATVD